MRNSSKERLEQLSTYVRYREVEDQRYSERATSILKASTSTERSGISLIAFCESSKTGTVNSWYVDFVFHVFRAGTREDFVENETAILAAVPCYNVPVNC